MVYSDSPNRKICRATFASKKLSKKPCMETSPQPKKSISTYFLGKRFSPSSKKTPWKSARHQKNGGPSHPPHPSARRAILQPAVPAASTATASAAPSGVPLLAASWAVHVSSGRPMAGKEATKGGTLCTHHIWRTGKSGDFWKMGRDKPDEEGEGCWQGGNDDPDWQTVILSQNLKEVPEVSGFFRKIIFVTRIQVQKLGNYRPYSLKGISYGLFANRNRSVVDVCCLVGSSWPRNCGST